jgi:hypothetical protein
MYFAHTTGDVPVSGVIRTPVTSGALSTLYLIDEHQCGIGGDKAMQPPRDDRSAREEQLLALLRARGLTSVEIERLIGPEMEGQSLAERIEQLLSEEQRRQMVQK